MKLNTTYIITIENINIEVIHRKVKYINLRLIPTYGDVRIVCPMNVSKEYIIGFANSKLFWIKQKREKYNTQRIDYTKKYEDNEEFYLFGEKITLRLKSTYGNKRIELIDNELIIHTKDPSDKERTEAIIYSWYREYLHNKIIELIPAWEDRLKVSSSGFSIRKMKTRWGSCNIKTKKIWISFSLVYYPLECLEYIIAHELCHLIIRNHSKNFYNILHNHFPNHKEINKVLNNFVYLH